MKARSYNQHSAALNKLGVLIIRNDNYTTIHYEAQGLGTRTFKNLRSDTSHH